MHNHPENVSSTACPVCLEEGEQIWLRAQRGFSDEDVWGLNTYLARLLADSLTFLAENMHGCPPRLVGDGDVDAGCKRWEEILREMALGFANYVEADDLTDSPELQRSFDLLREWWHDLWD